jgi:hypothetical protein
VINNIYEDSEVSNYVTFLNSSSVGSKVIKDGQTHEHYEAMRLAYLISGEGSRPFCSLLAFHVHGSTWSAVVSTIALPLTYRLLLTEVCYPVPR